MRKILLATTAIIAAGAYSAPAQAELEVTVGGFAAFQAAAFDNDVAGSTDRDFQSEAQIRIHADATADNGLQYGAHIVLESSTSDTANAQETGVYLAGGWGRVEMGDMLGASELVVFAPTVGIGQINGSYDDYLRPDDPATVGVDESVSPYDLNDRGDHTFTATDSGRDTKVTYFTPKYMGFQAGVSYAPETEADFQGENVMINGGDRTAGSAHDVVEIGLRYEGEFEGVMFKAGGNYNFGDANAPAAREDLNAWTAGAQAAYQGFTFGGSYTDNSDSLRVANQDNYNWNVGMTYENGPWGVGVSYLDVSEDYTGGNDFDATVLGGTYMVAPGLTVGADLGFYDRENVDDGYVFVTDVTAAF